MQQWRPRKAKNGIRGPESAAAKFRCDGETGLLTSRNHNVRTDPVCLLPTYFAIGVHAYTSSISNIAPRLSLQLAEAGLTRDFAQFELLMQSMCIRCTRFGERAKGYEVSAMKAAMEIIGMPPGPVRPPLRAFIGWPDLPVP
jgi:hypothetical protein